ncbi:MAG: alcohol dehydrogenase catalytic domain-containing protein, partial [Planctomycetota bacterium]
MGSENMLALVYDAEAHSAIIRDDYPVPGISRSEALVRVRMAGICRTDLEILKGYMNFEGVMGHEFVGTVVDGPAAWKTKRVVAEINCICGKCDMCTSGLSNHCRNRTVMGIDKRDGVFAEYVAVPVRNLHEVPRNISDVEAVFVEPLAAA